MPRKAAPKPNLDHIAEPLRHLAIPIAELVSDPKNARKHGPENLAAIRGSLRRFGQRLPLVVQRQGMIVRAGNGRLAAAIDLGWTHVAAVIVDESEAQAVAFAISDNRTAELAEWDDPVLQDLLKMVESGDAELDQMMADLRRAPDPFESEIQPSADELPDLSATVRHVITLRYDDADEAALKKFCGQTADGPLDPIHTGRRILERIKAIAAD